MSDAPTTTEVELDDVFLDLEIAKPLLDMGKGSGESSLSAAKARRLVEDLLKQGLTDESARDVANTIAKNIVRSLPGDAMFESTIRSMDLRPYVQATIDSGWLNQFSDDIGQGATRLMEQQQETAQEIAATAATAGGLDPAGPIETIRKFDPKKVGLNPGANIGSVEAKVDYQQLTPEEAQTAAFDPLAADEAAAVPDKAPVFAEDELRAVINLPASALDLVIQEEIKYNEQLYQAGDKTARGTMRGGIQVTEALPGGGAVPNPANPAQTGAGRKVSYYGARTMLFEMDAKEYEDMQEKLASAGYFDKLGKAPIKGDINDPTTQQAWDLMLVDSFSRNTPITSLLAKRGAEYRKTVVARNEQSMIKNWQQDTRAAADAMAIERIGRRLTVEEFAKVTSYLSDLQEDRKDDVLGVDQNAWRPQRRDDGTSPFGYGFSEDEAVGRISKVLEPEVDLAASWDAAQTVNKYFGVETVGTPSDPSKPVARPTGGT